MTATRSHLLGTGAHLRARTASHQPSPATPKTSQEPLVNCLSTITNRFVSTAKQAVSISWGRATGATRELRTAYGVCCTCVFLHISRLLRRRFPPARVWPPVLNHVAASEEEIAARARLPPREQQEHLLELYFTYVHPVFPVVVKSQFLEDFRARYDLSVSFDGSQLNCSQIRIAV